MLIGNLRNMNKSVNTGENSCKRTVRSNAYYLNIRNIAYGKFIIENGPRIILFLLVAERNLSLLRVKSLDIYFNGIADRKNFGRIFDTLPGKLGNMNHSVNAADIYKRAVRSK